jgi:hypothetical protein
VSVARLAELDALIDELTIDCYGEEEQFDGLLVGAEGALEAPEAAAVVGVPVRVIGVKAGPDMRSGLIAICDREGSRHEIALADVTFEPDTPLGRVAAAYRRWLGFES